MIDCRILPHHRGDGPTNMATDEALLNSVASRPSSSVVRTYTWSTPTLSLGYFQYHAEVEADPRWNDKPIVRRPTGGGALWHDLEVTYAVIVPAAHPFARPSTALYRAIHAGISGRLRDHGVQAHRRGDPSPLVVPARGRPFLCFQDRDADDVVVGPVKLVGSAQRRRAGAVLQHGSLLLARSPVTPELRGLNDATQDLGDRSLPSGLANDALYWADTLQAILPEVLGGAVFEEDLSPEEQDRADTLQKDVYQQRSWTCRR